MSLIQKSRSLEIVGMIEVDEQLSPEAVHEIALNLSEELATL